MIPGADPRVARLEEELTRVRRELEIALDAIPEERMHRAPPGSWTPAQLVWHLAKIERGVARLLERLDAALPAMATVPPGPSLANVTKLLDKFPYYDRTKKLEAPEGLRPPGTVDLVQERARLADGRVQLLEAARRAGPRLSLIRYDHVFFGPFDGWQWTLMIARHEERHLLQLHEILQTTP